MEGFAFGVLVSAFLFGFRHGIDWDHIAAITDITGSQDERRTAIWFGTLYALGHAAVVFLLGVLAIVLGDRLPEGVDEAMGKVVGVTLVVLGVYVFVSLIRHGREFRLRSRWMLVFAGARRAAGWVRDRVRPNGDAGQEPAPVGRWHHGHHGRPGHHHHEAEDHHEEVPSYGRGTALLVGMIHGVGAETPTQVVLFVSASQVASPMVGVIVLLAFLVGLLASNSIITLGSAYGFLQASRNFALYATVAVVVGAFSLGLGVLFLLGKESVLPAFF